MVEHFLLNIFKISRLFHWNVLNEILANFFEINYEIVDLMKTSGAGFFSIGRREGGYD
jgi:hypothetical protein